MPVKKCDDIVEDHLEESLSEDSSSPSSSPRRPVRRSKKVKVPAYLGKSLSAVESDIYMGEITALDGKILEINEPLGGGQIRNGRPGAVLDPLRAEARKFFTLNQNGQMVYLNNSLSELGSNAEGLESWGSSPLTITATSEALFSFGSMFPIWKQDYDVTSTSYDDYILEIDEDGEIWKTLFKGGMQRDVNFNRYRPLIDEEKTFTDHYTNIVAPFSQEEIDKYINNINNPAYADIESNYNFFLTGYEPAIKQATVKEYELANLYSELTKENNNIQQTLSQLGTGLEYVREAKNILTSNNMPVTHKFKNIGFPSSQVESLLRGTDIDDLYAMNATLDLKTEKTGDFIAAAETAGMTDSLLRFVINQVLFRAERTSPTAASVFASGKGKKDMGISLGITSNEQFALSSEQVVAINGQYHIATQQSEQELEWTDFETWLQTHFDSDSTYIEDPDFNDKVFLLGIPENEADKGDECGTFANTLKALILSGKVQQIVNDNFRTFEEMLEGKEAYNETIIYEIVKKSVEGSGAIQRVFVPNIESLDVLKYIDTQVKYDKSYIYEVFAHQLVVGTIYKYSDSEWHLDRDKALDFKNGNVVFDDNYGKIKFSVTYSPSLRIIRLPIYSQQVKILDNAPVWPNVELLPYKGVSNQFLINLNSNVGDYDLQPIIVNSKDIKFVKEYRKARKLLPTDPIKFKSDDPVSRFEIYRTSNPPGSYQDFAGNLLTTLASKNATAASYVDNISPNQKYYYMFRGVDVHGNRSNPTEVYQVEMVEFEGMIFFNQRIYEFEDKLQANNNISPSRNFRRYLKINPNLIQSIVNYDKTFPPAQGDVTDSAYNANTVVLGQAGEPVWNKKFKIRVTSKSSGKKLDLNLTCKAKFVKTSKPN